jgi:predicted secreted Zn-dependent protease
LFFPLGWRRAMVTQTKRKLLAVVTLVAAATSAHATVQVDSGMKYYDATGTTPAAILASLNSLGPLIDGKRWWANTHWKVNVNYYYRPDNDGCRFTSVTTTLNIEITMPQLGTKVSAQTRKWFDEKMKTLLEHEHGHRDIALGIAENIEAAYIKMRAATCKELIDDSQGVLDGWIKRGKEDQAHYDFVTKSGLKQQAWPTATAKKPVEASPSKDQSQEKQPVAEPVTNIPATRPRSLNELLFGR